MKMIDEYQRSRPDEVELFESNRRSKRDSAQTARTAGTLLLAFSAFALVLSLMLLTFGQFPLALVMLALVPFALVGAWLLRRGQNRVERMGGA
jgi:Flp pilus assembly protein TadB